MTANRHCFLVTVVMLSWGWGGAPRLFGEEMAFKEWRDARRQLRWPVEEMKGAKTSAARADDFRAANEAAAVHQTVEGLLADGEEKQALETLQSWMGKRTTEADPSIMITEAGCQPGEKRINLLLARDLAYEYALRSVLTGNKDDTQKAKKILFRFAETMPHWPYYDRKGVAHTHKERNYLTQWDANAFWRAHPHDMSETLPLLKTYDLLRQSLTLEEKARLENDLFLFYKKRLDQFTGTTRLYHNLTGYHLIPLIRYGQVLERPEIIHEVVRYWGDILQYSYSADGFFREVTPDYHQQITWRIIREVPRMLKGYSDPDGYVDPVDGLHFSKLDLTEQEKYRLDPIRNALNPLVLPDGSYVSLNDAHPKKLRAPEPVVGDTPGLLGVSGVAKLGAKGMAAFLQFGGIRGHDHHDALNLVWFAGGREVFSETGYVTIPGSNSTREWHTITASHHTIAVDEKTQFQNRSAVQLPGGMGAVAANPLKPKSGAENRGAAMTVVAGLPAAARHTNQGRLLLWDGSDAGMQAMEAGQENAYPGVTSLFRRTIVMLPTGDGEGFLVDIFRVRGGAKHDYFLRGGYDVSRINFGRELRPAEGNLYSYIRLKESAPIEDGTVARIIYPDGFQTDSHLAGLWGGDSVKQELLLGSAPQILGKGEAPIAIIRRASENGAPLESCFVFVHEASSRKKTIRKVSVERQGMDMVVSIESARGRDLVFSGLSEESRFDFQGWQFTGRLACGKVEGGLLSGRVFSGADLKNGADRIAEGKAPCKGKVVETTRKETGDPRHTLLVALDGALPPQTFRLAHIDFGDVIRFSIPVTSVTDEGKGKLRVELAHSPGFVVTEEGISMTQFPGWRVFREARVHLE